MHSPISILASQNGLSSSQRFCLFALLETLSQLAGALANIPSQYFSTAERLRLANGVPSPSSASRTKSIRESARLSPRRKSLFDPSICSFQRTLKPVRKHLGRSTTAPSVLVNPDNAAWFASLPPAVRRKHFTKEEQILFANERHSVILDAADELLNRRCLQDSPLEPPPFSFPPRPRTSYFSDNTEHADDISFFDDTDIEQDEAEVDSENDGMANYSLDKFPWLDDESDLNLKLDDYHAAIVETTHGQAPSVQRRVSRRNHSLSAISLRRRSAVSSQPNLRPHSRAGVLFTAVQSSLLPPSTHSQHRSKASISSIEPRATHYQDPTARMKLRVYLASPSKFDEAVEFGFPSLQDQAGVHNDRPRTSPRLTHESGRTFLTDEPPSLLADDGSLHGDFDDVPDPRTPQEADFRIHRKTQKNSNERHSIKPQLVRNITEQYAQSTTLDREMTIHMTLTRPDLRTPDETTSKKVNSLPLEHCKLPKADGQPSMWDTLPDDQSRMKRFWRKLKTK